MILPEADDPVEVILGDIVNFDEMSELGDVTSHEIPFFLDFLFLLHRMYNRRIILRLILLLN